jgi:hypothetical protein
MPALPAQPTLPTLPSAPATIAVACHDAGACNLILPWLDQPQLRLQAWVAGPAEVLWRRRFGTRGLCASLQEALEGAAVLVSGTGWASTLEHDARVEAARRGLHTVAVIDHWVNYPERFERDGHVQWPDEFWLTNDQALALAARHFPRHRLRLQPDLQLAEQLAAAGPTPPPEGAEILYLMEPARSRWGRDEEGEWQALAWFEAMRRQAGLPEHARVRLRPHPSDPPGKYDAWLAGRPHVALDRHPTLAQALSGARWVVGCESHAMTVALACGREVYTSLPPWAPPCRLPHAGIRRLVA